MVLVEWFDGLRLLHIVAVALALQLLELCLIPAKPSLRAVVLKNAWQAVGVLIPCLWLLRCAQSYWEVVLVALMMAWFGIYKPSRSKAV